MSTLTSRYNMSTSGQPSPELMRRLTETEMKRLLMSRYRKRNALVGLCLLGGVLTAFGYSMFAVRQETLNLDEIVDPNANLSNNPALFPDKAK